MSPTRQFAVLLTLVPASAALAGGSSVYTGPHGYTTSADNPFPIGTAGFCVETFEDGTLTPGGVTGNGSVIGPGGHATDHREQINSMLSALSQTPLDQDGWSYGQFTNTLVPMAK